jgi:Alginate lyase
VIGALALVAASSATAAPVLDLRKIERARVLAAAEAYLTELPVTVTATSSARSAGGPHDYFSAADYWWPDPQSPGGPYVQRDGLSNPDNFDGHRQALRRLSLQVPALAAAFRLTGEARYATHAGRHLRAWFVDEATRMSPHLRYAQAIQGRVTGRGVGIIDTLHLVEVARAIEALGDASGLTPAERATLRQWFADYVQWMMTHEYGIAERDARNNHATCWVLQVAAFARIAGRDDLVAESRGRFKQLLADQMAPDGSFPQETRRTKPYAYSLFNLEALTAIAQLLTTPADDLFRFTLADGRGLRRGMAFMAPFMRSRRGWPYPQDVMYDGEWPMRQSSLLFAGLALGEPSYLELWRALPADSKVEEVIRNFFVRQPLLWVSALE